MLCAGRRFNVTRTLTNSLDILTYIIFKLLYMSNCGNNNGYPCASGLCKESLATTMKRINKKVRLDSSQHIFKKKNAAIVKDSDNKTPSLQISTRAGIRGNKLRAENYGKNGSQQRKGVDKKHGSYERYLGKIVGSVIRSEPLVVRTAEIGQPRSRTGTSCGCGKETAPKLPTECCGAVNIVSSLNLWLPAPTVGYIKTDFTLTAPPAVGEIIATQYTKGWQYSCCSKFILDATVGGLPVMGVVNYETGGVQRIVVWIKGAAQATSPPPLPLGILTNYTTGITTNLTLPVVIATLPTSVGNFTQYFYNIGGAPRINKGDFFTIKYD